MKKRNTKNSSLRETAPNLWWDYYQPAFSFFHLEIEQLGVDLSKPHPKRASYWQLVPPGEYTGLDAVGWVKPYLRSVSETLKELIEKHSLAYWLHIYRRLRPGGIGRDNRPQSIGLTRAALEAAFQKFGKPKLCNGIGVSSTLTSEEIMSGFYKKHGFLELVEVLRKVPQLVLRDFDHLSLLDLYNAERLAYEIWRSTAMLRIIGKGAPVEVNHSEEMVFDTRSSELNDAVVRYDDRARMEHVTATGTVFSTLSNIDKATGYILLPHYNVGKAPSSQFAKLFKFFGVSVNSGFLTNFVWMPYHMKAFLDAHRPLADAFFKKHGLHLESVLSVLVALFFRTLAMWKNGKGKVVIRGFQRAYEGPIVRKVLIRQTKTFMPNAAKLFHSNRRIGAKEVEDSLKFWELTDKKAGDIDLQYPGPFSVLIPCGRGKVLIDFAWVYRSLYDLFYGVSISDQNFKGEALENLVREKGSILPWKPCKNKKGEKRQIDGSFQSEETLIVVECRAYGKSIAFDRGEPEAIERRVRLIEKIIDDVDRKAAWLSANPIGLNYDISKFKRILPIGITPFVEYVPSLVQRYWVTDRVPRVMTPQELKELLESGRLAEARENTIAI